MTVAKLDDLRARNSGFRTRTPKELLGDLTAACMSLGSMADHGLDVHALDAIARTVEGIQRLLIDLRVGGADHAA